ncbi:type VI secretion system contractile sheath domain-containing protein [Neoroseomonas rubea]|uniref:type VI secretion system contractile sheath domain-containing protein n=1 Tax=Neoroseomonas rubea TaxID=2748666 RepID=UPI0018DF207C|nr:type VI secretion system contractile sheath large subunit [Roseomonas rubea]
MTLPPIALSPRFAMTYPFEAEGAERDRELPFRVGVIADLAGDAGVSLPPPVERHFLPLAEDGIAGAMAQLQPGYRHEFSGQHAGASITLTFRSLDDFATAGLASQFASAGVTPTDEHVEAIRQNERFQRLKATWFGLDLLAARAGPDPAVRIGILPLSRAEFVAALRRSDDGARGWLEGRIHHDVFECRGAEPLSVLVGDQVWTASTEDIEALERMAAIAAPAHLPFVSAADESLCDLGRRAGLGENAGTADAAWHALRNSDASRFLVLTTPPEIEAVRGPFWVAAHMVDAFRRDGFCADIPGVEASSLGQPEAPLARFGFMPVVHRTANAPVTIVGMQTLHRPRQYDSHAASENAAIAATLPHVMVTARIAHYLKAMARDRIGAYAEAGDLERWMARWLSNLAQAGAPSGTLPRHPLYQGRLEVKAMPGEAGVFNAVCYLRPWLAMAELTSEIRMIVRLPRQQ